MKLSEMKEIASKVSGSPLRDVLAGIVIIPDDRIVRFTDRDLAGASWIKEKDANFIRAATRNFDKLLAVAEAARNLRAEVLGLNIASYEIMQAIGQTNWSLLKERCVEVGEALKDLESEDAKS